MATNYTTPQDQTFRDAWKSQASGSNAKDFGGDWPTRNTFNEKLDYVKKYYTSADTKNKDLALKLGVEWLQSNIPKGLLKADGTPYEIADYQDIILPTKTVQNTATVALNNAMFSAAKDIVNGTNTTKQSSRLVDLAAGDLIGAGGSSSYNPNAFIKGFNTVVAPTLVTPSGSLADIKKQYGSLYDKSGKPLFSDTELKNVYNGSPDALQSFRSKLNTAVEDAVKATDPSFAKAGSNQGSAYVTARNKLLSDPAGTLAQNYNTNVSGLKTSDKGGWVTSSGTVVGGPATTGNGITGLLPKGSFKDANGNFAYTGGEIEPDKMTEFTQSYNPNKGVYRAPTLDASGKLVSNPTSPYSNILNGMLSNYKDPFASGYTSSLDSMQPAAMTSTQLASLSKPFTTNATASDLVKLANSAGGEYDPTNKAGSTLPPALRQLYQNQTLPDDTVKAKPGVPDPTKMKVPEANFLDANGNLTNGNIAGGNLTNIPMGGDAKTATESASGFTPDTTLKDVPGATITNESGTLTKPDITDKATADALHKAEQDRIAKEAADKAEADKKALYYNADGTLTGLGFYTYNPTGNYQDYLDKIAADKAATDTDRGPRPDTIKDPVDTDRGPRPDTGGITSLVDKAAAEREAAEKERLAGVAEWEYNSNKAREETAAWWKRAAEREAAEKAAAEKAAAELLAPTPKTDAQLTGTKWTSADIDSGELTFDELTRLRELNSAASKTNGTKSLGPYTTMDATGWSAELPASIPKTDAQLTGIDRTKAVSDAVKLTNAERVAAFEAKIPYADYAANLAVTQKPAVTQQGAVGIAGNPNVGSFTSADNMNTSATGVGAPITSLLTPNTGASGTPTVTQKPAVTQKPTVIQQQAVANEPANDWGVPYSQLRAEAAKSAAANPVVTTPYYSNYD
jgi:hypothetical protein